MFIASGKITSSSFVQFKNILSVDHKVSGKVTVPLISLGTRTAFVCSLLYIIPSWLVYVVFSSDTVMLSSELQSRNASSPMLATSLPIASFFKDEQPFNKYFAIDAIPSGMLISDKEEQSANALSSIVFICDGSFKKVKLVQPLKALLPIDFTLSGIFMLFKPEQL